LSESEPSDDTSKWVKTTLKPKTGGCRRDKYWTSGRFWNKKKPLPITDIGANAEYGVEVARIVNRLFSGTGEPKKLGTNRPRDKADGRAKCRTVFVLFVEKGFFGADELVVAMKLLKGNRAKGFGWFSIKLFNNLTPE
jgi:hypothetical protein